MSNRMANWDKETSATTALLSEFVGYQIKESWPSSVAMTSLQRLGEMAISIRVSISISFLISARHNLTQDSRGKWRVWEIGPW